jgi:hypothetical protein
MRLDRFPTGLVLRRREAASKDAPPAGTSFETRLGAPQDEGRRNPDA